MLTRLKRFVLLMIVIGTKQFNVAPTT